MAESNQTTPQISEQEYKDLCKRVRAYQIKNGKTRKRAKPILKPIGETSAQQKTLLVQKTGVDWDVVEVGAPFALDPVGVQLYTKAGKSRALCLNTMTSIPVGGGLVYRVFL